MAGFGPEALNVIVD